ncbi:MAG: bifunctional indole-3-glycerol-phosphate synthase TrpC/phosphoribosylanthranilate isomerase TrpF [Shewanella sp.]|nr:bifunctional indole-3-glycerol-phosphate synthase TrpC/phosphoribosylanthranilate isomerase TrpF [Shewanella sp.]MCF1429718.1 bifunctional indole-3-glycerol-phosphate synthase TrpC/phosphoribosylanthranilate isomerase TrpF [Shewanella sp.]MCF1437272.1 bifunctional indole-3-glycerol-phosphate synthase TrpC/phosphoribosylanthranilate isomerase TrpF [Shewanella sp.]MCF1457872.1 bifunctional indole-3-glycerol-phosphate synthase TrpC/phosphoribosylanthranilate isomerase TrpF [Shewanella sp.]
MSNVLTKIVNSKTAHIKALKQRFGEQLAPQLSERSLYDALAKPEAGFILECKKASPSKGLIRADFDIADIASVYRRHASAISVLTDEAFFQGDMAYIPQVKSRVHQPILCKDFFVSPYQVQLAAHQGADAILLMLSVLDDAQYQELASEAAKYRLDILTEVSNEDELDRAIALEARIIGINNRNLRDLSTVLATTETLAPRIPADTLVISESGIYSHQDVRRLSPLVAGFLVGSSLMAQEELDLACRRLIHGEHKVCGLTRIQDMQTAAQAGAVYGGMIFAEHSKRKLTLKQAKVIATANSKAAQKLALVGVFVNQPPEVIASYTSELGLGAVQLHGQESAAEITRIRAMLPDGIQIWKAIAVEVATGNTAKISNELIAVVDRLLYDSKDELSFGGSGEVFNWQQQLPNKSSAMLAGGLNADNAKAADNAGFLALDFNSGLEDSPGIKQANLVEQAFTRLRQY